MRRMSVLHQNSGGIGKSIPSALEISLDPRDFPRASPSGNLSGLGKSLGRRGWISQYLPRFGGAWIQFSFGFTTMIYRDRREGGRELSLDSFAGTVASPGWGVLSQVVINICIINPKRRADTETPADMLLSYCSDINKDSLYQRFFSCNHHHHHHHCHPVCDDT